MTEENLGPVVEAFNRGDPGAFKIIFDRFYVPLFKFCFPIVRDKTETEEIILHTLLKCWGRRGHFPGSRQLTGFLYVTARNRCLDFLRHKKVEEAHYQKLSQLIRELDQAPKERDEHSEILIERIYDEIERLPHNCKDVFKLSFLEGLSNKEIAKKLGLKEKTVRNQKTKALGILRVTLVEKRLVTSGLVAATAYISALMVNM